MIKSETTERLISPQRVTSILVTKAVSITSSALMLAAENDIPVVFVNNIGQPVVQVSPFLHSGHSVLRKKQYAYTCNPESFKSVIRILFLKTEQQISNLSFWANRKSSIADKCNTARKKLTDSIKYVKNTLDKIKDIEQKKQFFRGWEGNNAREYWKCFSALSEGLGWSMKGRTHRPASDEINATLNYLYGMLYHHVEAAIASNGLDPQLGIWHADEFQTPSLSFDLIEPLRPKTDFLLSDLLIKGCLRESWFETDTEYGYVLTRQGKQQIVQFFNNWLETRVKLMNRVTAYKNHILFQASCLKMEIENWDINEIQS